MDRSRPRFVCIAVLVAGLVVSACGPAPEPEPDFIWRGDNLDIYGYDVEQDYYCGGTFAHMDEFMGRVSEVFGAQPDPQPIVRVGPPEFYERYCPESSTGCIDYPDVTVIRADRLPLDHELVHLAEQEVAGCPVLLAEGLAEYYALSSRNRPVQPWNIEDAIKATLDETMSLPGQYYPLAGHFIGFLIETRGGSIRFSESATERAGFRRPSNFTKPSSTSMANPSIRLSQTTCSVPSAHRGTWPAS